MLGANCFSPGRSCAGRLADNTNERDRKSGRPSERAILAKTKRVELRQLIFGFMGMMGLPQRNRSKGRLIRASNGSGKNQKKEECDSTNESVLAAQAALLPVLSLSQG